MRNRDAGTAASRARAARHWRRHLCLVTSLATLALPATAQRATENAVTAAEDAFGVSVGRESIGLYTSDNVRGFSAIDAGNVRFDGLYFDQVWGPSPRLLQSTTMRVGIASQGFLFPAPTGVVDYALRRPGKEFSASAYTMADSYDNRILEVDLNAPLAGDWLALGVGAANNIEGYADGGRDHARGLALMLHAQPDARLDLLAFSHRTLVTGATITPFFIPGGDWLPPDMPRRHFPGPAWLVNVQDGGNTGLVTRWAPLPDWKVELGLFDSMEHDPIAYNSLYLDLNPQGRADQVIEADSDNRYRSHSGELRVSHAFGDAELQQVLVANLRGRLRERHYGGSATVDLGPVSVGEYSAVAQPPLAFGPKDEDRIRQTTAGVAWRGRWREAGELTVDVQRSDYDKQVTLPGLAPADTHSRPWLPGVAGSLRLGEQWLAYASDTRGLEDSGSAPPGAANRNQPLAAVRTHQQDAGLRWRATPKLTLVAGVFDLHKPYYSFDAGNRYALVGQVINRGVEFSLSGAVTPNLDVVLGGVAARPRVTGGSGGASAPGPEPVGLPRLRALANVEWRPRALQGLALDMGTTCLGRRPATADNQVFLPARATVDLGARYRLQLGSHPAQLRLALSNVGDVNGFDTYGAGTYDVSAGRVLQISLGVDG